MRCLCRADRPRALLRARPPSGRSGCGDDILAGHGRRRYSSGGRTTRKGSTEARAWSSEKGTLGQKRSVRTHAVSDWRAAAISIPTLFRVKQGLSTKAAVEASYGGLGGRWKRGY